MMAGPNRTTEQSTGNSRIRVGRRGLLGFLVAAPTLTVAVRLGFGADAAPLPTGLPGLADFVDLGDLLTTVALPTSRMLVLEITPDGTNKVTKALVHRN